MWFLIPILTLFFLIAPIWAVVAVVRQRRELRALRERFEALEGRVAREGSALIAVPPPGVPTAPATPPPPPIPFEWTPTPAREVAHATGSTAVPRATGGAPTMGSGVGATVPPAVASATQVRRGFDSSRAEEMVGSVWLQNVGSVLLLLGVFFLILWGYTTGRLGPGVLVGAGVALGITLGWRGDRMARSLPLFGHALIGVGLGTIYLSLYLGHFTLRVLPTPAAFAALTIVAIGSIIVGLRYRVQSIAALGVLGAFVPQLMAAWIPLKGFAMSAPGLLGYLAAVDAVVFLLAARAGWSGLDLACLFLSAVTWTAQFRETSWGWGVQAGLSTLFTALGLSPLPRLARREGTVRGIDLAVIALAPLCLVAASSTLLATAPRSASATLLLALAAVYMLAALWADARRPERDLWRPLTGAAVLFLTAAVERALGDQRTPMAWCVEGTLLVWLGLRARGDWLRRCGYAVSGLGALWVLTTLSSGGDWQPAQLPAFYPAGIRDLVCILAMLGGAWLLARGRGQLSLGERFMPEVWTAVGNLMVVVWTGRESVHLSRALEGVGGRWTHPRDLAAPRGDQRLNLLSASLMGFLWMAQSAVLVGMSGQRGRGFLRVCGYAAGTLAAIAVFARLNLSDGWSNDLLPILHPAGLLTLATIALIAAMAAGLAGRRDLLGASEARVPELLTIAASLLLLGWTAQEADHLARSIAGIPGAWAAYSSLADRASLQRVGILAASFTSAGWLIQALLLLALGWMRSSAFLRWAGLGLTGVTVLKFLVVDLQMVDVFWRFLTAIVVGAALLGISYAYQRRTRG